MGREVVRDEELFDLLRMLAPGTLLREGLENILRARTGGLIVIGDSPEVMDVIEGGFYINKEFSPTHIYELAKMDGAIILSKDLKRILYANSLLIPNSSIFTSETGTRHKSAERVSKQTSEVVICISQRKNIITVYKGHKKYVLKETHMILARANQALQTLEKYKMVLDSTINNLNFLEFEDMVTVEDVMGVIQRIEMVMRISIEIEGYLCELGDEGRLVSMQLDELISNIDTEALLMIEDYIIDREEKNAIDIQREMRLLSYDELMDTIHLCRILGYPGGVGSLAVSVFPKGYRLLNKIPRLPFAVIKKLVEKFGNFQEVLQASIEQLDDVDGIGEVRAKSIMEGLRRIREQSFSCNRK